MLLRTERRFATGFYGTPVPSRLQTGAPLCQPLARPRLRHAAFFPASPRAVLAAGAEVWGRVPWGTLLKAAPCPSPPTATRLSSEGTSITTPADFLWGVLGLSGYGREAEELELEEAQAEAEALLEAEAIGDGTVDASAEVRGPAPEARLLQRTQRRGPERGPDRDLDRRRGRRTGRRFRSRENTVVPQISELLKEGQEVLIQIAKE